LREHMVLDPLHSVMLVASDDAREIQAKSIERVRAAFHIMVYKFEARKWYVELICRYERDVRRS
jgi:cell fate regulator YaaT (PSP1 superfamily)